MSVTRVGDKKYLVVVKLGEKEAGCSRLALRDLGLGVDDLDDSVCRQPVWRQRGDLGSRRS